MNYRRRKIAGLILTALGVVMIGGTIAVLEKPEWLRTASSVQLLWAGLAWWAGGNAVALGLIILIGGLQEVPLHRGARARRGMFVKIVGANLILLPAAALAWLESLARAESWLALVGFVALMVVVRYGIVVLRTGWKYDALTADEVRARDPRPPVVYLRSFRQDDELMLTAGGRIAQALQPLAQAVYPLVIAGAGPEQELSMMLQRVGPVIAIGQPGESLPDLGAARMYVADDRWRATVDDLLSQSAVVLVRAGTTPNLWWEIEEVMKLVPRQRIMIVSLLGVAGSGEFNRGFAERFGEPSRLEAPPVPRWLQLLKRLSRYRNPPWRIVFFDADGQPRDVPIGFTVTPTGFLLVTTGRPYRDMLFAAMKRVFAAQGRPWVTPRTHTTAVLMAMFGGPVCLHLFYLGKREEAWRRLRGWWKALPFVHWPGDAVQLALIDRREFDRRYPGAAFSRADPDSRPRSTYA